MNIHIHWISNKTKFDFYKKTRIMILKYKSKKTTRVYKLYHMNWEYNIFY